jgi:hypothetical protein
MDATCGLAVILRNAALCGTTAPLRARLLRMRLRDVRKNVLLSIRLRDARRGRAWPATP